MSQELLQKLGLTKNESLIYLTLLKTGPAKVSLIIKQAQFKSGKIYQVLDSLVEKGIVSYIIKNKVKHYLPENPHKILDFLHERK